MPTMTPLSPFDPRLRGAYNPVEREALFGKSKKPLVISLSVAEKFRVVPGFKPGEDEIRTVSWQFREGSHRKDLVERSVSAIDLQMLPTIQTVGTRAFEFGQPIPNAHLRTLIRLQHEGHIDVLSKEFPNVFRDEQGVVEVIWDTDGWYVLTHSWGSTYLYPEGTRVFFLD